MGTCVIFLPGLMCDEAVWKAQLAALAERAASSVADFGRLDSLERMAETVLEGAPDDCVIVGHSMGGRVALEIYRRAREQVRALALFDTGYQARASGEAGERERTQR